MCLGGFSFLVLLLESGSKKEENTGSKTNSDPNVVFFFCYAGLLGRGRGSGDGGRGGRRGTTEQHGEQFCGAPFPRSQRGRRHQGARGHRRKGSQGGSERVSGVLKLVFFLTSCFPSLGSFCSFVEERCNAFLGCFFLSRCRLLGKLLVAATPLRLQTCLLYVACLFAWVFSLSEVSEEGAICTWR